MKQIKLLVAIVFLSFTSAFAQEVELLGNYSTNTSKIYKNGIGYGVGYYQHLESRDRLGVSIHQNFYNSEYDNIQYSIADAESYIIDQIWPDNKRTALKISYFGTNGSTYPYFIGWLNFNFGIRYSIGCPIFK